MAEVKVGCCSIGPRFYRALGCGETQQTFYDFVAEARAKKWYNMASSARKIAATRQDKFGLSAKKFEFTVKALQVITHPASSPTYRRMKNKIGLEENYGYFKATNEVFQAYEHTLKIAKVLGAHVIVFQSPASFKPSPANIKNITDFFSTADSAYLHFWETRGAWPMNIIKDVCETAGIGHVTDPFKQLPAAFVKNVAYLRLHGSPPGKKMYAYEYTGEDLATLRDKVENLANAGVATIYVMFNNIAMLKNALDFCDMIFTHS